MADAKTNWVPGNDVTAEALNDLGAAVNSRIAKAGSPFTVTNSTTVRSFDASDTSLDELADVIATLLQDLGKV